MLMLCFRLRIHLVVLDRGVQDLDVQVEGGSRFLGKKFLPRAYRADNEVEVDHGTDEGGRPRETTSPRPGFPDGPGIQSTPRVCLNGYQSQRDWSFY